MYSPFGRPNNCKELLNRTARQYTSGRPPYSACTVQPNKQLRQIIWFSALAPLNAPVSPRLPCYMMQKTKCPRSKIIPSVPACPSRLFRRNTVTDQCIYPRSYKVYSIRTVHMYRSFVSVGTTHVSGQELLIHPTRASDIEQTD